MSYDDAVAEIVAAIDRLAAATLAASCITPGSPEEKVDQTYQSILENTIGDGRKTKKLLEKVRAVIAAQKHTE